MNISISDYIDEYLHGGLFAQWTSLSGEQAGSLLTLMLSGLESQAVDLIALETVLFKIGSRDDLSFDVKTALPALLESYFDFLSASGKYPPAKNWLSDLRLITPKFLSRLKKDGSVKGETFRKNYSDVGRNGNCPCGSGKKFKKCCMQLLG
ncbi:MAG: SEC-C domain-containing protein [Chitinispirillales bacterium]|nr:SEC-C domain-containing protein [Chitinispirillales bacterium]